MSGNGKYKGLASESDEEKAKRNSQLESKLGSNDARLEEQNASIRKLNAERKVLERTLDRAVARHDRSKNPQQVTESGGEIVKLQAGLSQLTREVEALVKGRPTVSADGAVVTSKRAARKQARQKHVSTKGGHPDGACGNIGCARCSPEHAQPKVFKVAQSPSYRQDRYERRQIKLDAKARANA